MPFLEVSLTCGRQVRISVWRPPDILGSAGNDANASPPWLAKMDSLVFSDISGFEDYCPIYGWYGACGRVHHAAAVTMAGISTPLRHGELILVLANGGYTPKIESCLSNRRLIRNVTLVRAGGKLDRQDGNGYRNPAKLHEICFSNCYLEQMVHDWDHLIVTLRVEEKSHTAFMFGSDGRKQGQITNRTVYGPGAAAGAGAGGTNP